MNTNGNYYENRLRKRESFKRLINIGLSMICLLLEISLFAYMWQFHFQFQLVDPLQKIWYRGFLLENGIYSAILIFFSVTYGGMRLGYMKNTEIIFSQVFATLMADVLIYAELCMMARSIFPADMFLLMVFLQIIAVIIYANIANKIYRTAFPPRELLLIHGDRQRQMCIRDSTVIVPSKTLSTNLKAVRTNIRSQNASTSKRVQQSCVGRFWLIIRMVRSMR